MAEQMTVKNCLLQEQDNMASVLIIDNTKKKQSNDNMRKIFVTNTNNLNFI